MASRRAQIRAEAAAQNAQYANEGGGYQGGQGDGMLGVPGTPGYVAVNASSNKARVLANDIDEIEQRCIYLEERNRDMNDKMLRSHRMFIERAMVSTSKNFGGVVFRAWVKAMTLIGLENQLEQQTVSLDKCQKVANELGQALARQQETSRMHADGRQKIEADFDELAQAQVRLKSTSDKQTNQVNSLTRQLQLANQILDINKANARSVIEDGEEIAINCRQVKKEEEAANNKK